MGVLILGRSAAISGGTFDEESELPRVQVSSTYPTITGTTTALTGSGTTALQTAINTLMGLTGSLNHELVLDAGSTWTGNYNTGTNAGTGTKLIRSNGSLPAVGVRALPTDAAQMAKIVSTAAAEPVLNVFSNNVRLVGLEITTTNSFMYTMMFLSDPSVTVLANVNHHIGIDRCYIHGLTGATEIYHGVSLNSATSFIIDSTIKEFHSNNSDAQAIFGYTGPGPYRIENNYLEGSGENMMFGGADPAITDCIPSDIEILRNHMFKPTGWKDSYSVKNIFELKNSVRVLVEGNVFQNNPVDSQAGMGVLFTAINQSGAGTWCTVRDVTFRKNILHDVAGGINISADNSPEFSHPKGTRFSIHDNLLYNVGAFDGTTDGRMIQIVMAPDIIYIKNNTMIHTSPSYLLVLFDTGGSVIQMAGFNFIDNIATLGTYGIYGSGAGGGTAGLNAFVSSYSVTGNVLIGDLGGAAYPSGNTNPANLAAAVVNATTFAASGGAAGKGADFSALDTATFGVVTAGVSSMPS